MSIELKQLDTDEILRYMGCPPDQAGADLRNQAQLCGRHICQTARLRWAWRCYDILQEENGVRLSCGLLLPGRDLKAHLEGCVRAVVVWMTLLDAPRRVGLTASASHILIPRKSVTAILGVSDREIARNKRSCLGCPAQGGCQYRKAGGHCGLL